MHSRLSLISLIAYTFLTKAKSLESRKHRKLKKRPDLKPKFNTVARQLGNLTHIPVFNRGKSKASPLIEQHQLNIYISPIRKPN